MERQHYHSDYHVQQRCGVECEFCLCRPPAPGIWAGGETCSQIAFNMMLSGCLCLAKDPLSLWVHCAQSRYANVEHSEKWNYYYLCKLHLKSWLGGWRAYVLVCLRTAWREFRLCHVAQSVSFVSNDNWANGNAFWNTPGRQFSSPSSLTATNQPWAYLANQHIKQLYKHLLFLLDCQGKWAKGLFCSLPESSMKKSASLSQDCCLGLTWHPNPAAFLFCAGRDWQGLLGRCPPSVAGNSVWDFLLTRREFCLCFWFFPCLF